MLSFDEFMLNGDYMIGGNSIVKIVIFFYTQCKKFRLKIPYRYLEILKTEIISLSHDVSDYVYSK